MQRKAKDLYNELCVSKGKLVHDIETFDKLRMKYGGPAFPIGKGGSYDPENTGYIWCTNVLSQIVDNDPVWNVETEKGGEYATFAAAKKAALDKWTQTQKLSEFLLNGPVLDSQFLRGIALMKLAPQTKGYKLDDSALMPDMDRLSPRDYCEDPTAKSHDEARWKAHRIIDSKSRLLKHAKDHPEEGWNVAVIEALESSTSDMSKLDADRRNNIDRDEIVYWQVWDREWDEEKSGDYDSNGGFMEIVEAAGEIDDSYDYIRKPRPAYVPPWGPYYHFDSAKIPDETHGLAPLVATMRQSEDLNAAARAQLEDENSYRRFTIIDELYAIDPRTGKPTKGGKRIAEAITNARHRGVFTMPGFDASKAKEFSIGGPSPEGAVAYQNRLMRHDKMLGLSQSHQGNTGGGQTATSDVIADNAADRRIGLIRKAIHRTTTQIGHGFLWYLQRETQIAVMVGVHPETGDEVWVGGGPMGEGDDLGAYTCKIEPMSMEEVSPARLQAQAAMMTEFFGTLGPVMQMTPWIDWKRLAKVQGNAWNIPYMGELIREEVLAQAQGLAVALQTAGDGTETQKTEPQKVTTKPTAQPKLGAPTAHPSNQGKPQGAVSKPLTPPAGGSTKGAA